MYNQLYTGHIPDIYSTTQMLTCYDKYPEYLINLSEYDFIDEYNEARIALYGLDGIIYLLPADYDIISLVYNASLFEREGWEAPASFEELEALAPVIKEATPKQCLKLPSGLFFALMGFRRRREYPWIPNESYRLPAGNALGADCFPLLSRHPTGAATVLGGLLIQSKVHFPDQIRDVLLIFFP